MVSILLSTLFRLKRKFFESYTKLGNIAQEGTNQGEFTENSEEGNFFSYGNFRVALIFFFLCSLMLWSNIMPRTLVPILFITLSSDDEVRYIPSTHLRPCNWLTRGMYDEAMSLYGADMMKFIKAKFKEYRNNTDQITKDHVDYMYTCLENERLVGKCCPNDFYYIRRSHALYERDLFTGVLNRYRVHPKFEEVFVDYHGMRFAREEIKEYVKNKDFLDIGSFIGDSAVVLAPYTNKKIYSFDISPHHLQMVKYHAMSNHVSEKIVTINKGLGASESTMYINYDAENSAMTLTKSGQIPIPITTIDKEVFSRKIKPGFIKADIEGSEYEMLLGAKKTIEKFKPVLSISVYHNFAGLFRIPDYIKSFGYKIYFRATSIHHDHMGEMILFAYPIEIGNFDSFEDDSNPLTNDLILDYLE